MPSGGLTFWGFWPQALSQMGLGRGGMPRPTGRAEGLRLCDFNLGNFEGKRKLLNNFFSIARSTPKLAAWGVHEKGAVW
jgi:hypothetical protein